MLTSILWDVDGLHNGANAAKIVCSVYSERNDLIMKIFPFICFFYLHTKITQQRFSWLTLLFSVQ